MSNKFQLQKEIPSVGPFSFFLFFSELHRLCCQWVHSLGELANLGQIVSISRNAENWVSRGSTVSEENVILEAL